MGGGGGCCIGNFSCCVGNFSCCVGDGPIGRAVKSFFCSDSCCVGNSSQPRESELHAKEIADELANMKKRTEEISRKQEADIMEYISRSMNSFIGEVRDLNKNLYGGKSLDINTEYLVKKNEDLKDSVVGSIADEFNQRLVLTDKELSIILEERDKEKRGKNFQNFCDKLQKQAVKKLTKKIESTVKKQSELVEKEISARLKEVDNEMKDSIDALTAIQGMKKKDTAALEKTQAEYMYQCALCDLLIDETES